MKHILFLCILLIGVLHISCRDESSSLVSVEKSQNFSYPEFEKDQRLIESQKNRVGSSLSNVLQSAETYKSFLEQTLNEENAEVKLRRKVKNSYKKRRGAVSTLLSDLDVAQYDVFTSSSVPTLSIQTFEKTDKKLKSQEQRLRSACIAAINQLRKQISIEKTMLSKQKKKDSLTKMRCKTKREVTQEVKNAERNIRVLQTFLSA